MQAKTITARSTATRVHLGMAEAPEDGGKYAAICETHAGIIQFNTVRELRTWGHHPEDWCPGCQAEQLDPHPVGGPVRCTGAPVAT